MFKFITNRPFWVNLLAAIILGIMLVFLVLQLLGWITKHGEYLTVPTVQGKDMQQAIKLLESKGFIQLAIELIDFRNQKQTLFQLASVQLGPLHL